MIPHASSLQESFNKTITNEFGPVATCRKKLVKKYKRLDMEISHHLIDTEVNNMVCVENCWKNLVTPSEITWKPKHDEPYLKIKLLLEDMDQFEIVKRMAHPFTRLMQNGDTKTLGIYHASLLIGPCKTEWMGNSLALITQNTGSASTLMSLQIGKVLGCEKVKRALEIMTVHACVYNGFQKYHLTKRNCQHYVRELLGKLSGEGLIHFTDETVKEFVENGFEIKQDANNYVLQYMSQMKDDYLPEMTFTLDKEQLKYLDEELLEEVDDLKLVIETKQQLNKLYKQLTDEHLSREQYSLLKCFDRAFSIREMAFHKLVEETLKKMNAESNEKAIRKLNKLLKKLQKSLEESSGESNFPSESARLPDYNLANVFETTNTTTTNETHQQE